MEDPSRSHLILPFQKEKNLKKNTRANPDKGLWDFMGDALSGAAKKAIGHGLDLLTGFGDYELESNSLLSAATRGQNGGVPMLSNSKVANIVRHREYIRDVFSSTSSFSLKTLQINPGLDETFPWLANIANCYTNYRLRGMVFEFVSLASQLSTTPSLGFIAMGTQYNSFDPVYPDKKTLENSEYANSNKVSSNLCHPIECAQDQLSLAELYIRNGAIPSGADVRLYDIGRFSYAVGGQASSDVVIGELWCTYEVELYFPRLTSAFSNVNNYCALNSSASATFNTSPLFNAATRGTRNTFNPGVGGASVNELHFPQETVGQTFLVNYLVVGTSAAITAPLLTGTFVTITYNPIGGSSGIPANAVNSTSFIQTFFIKILPAADPFLSWGVAGSMPTAANWILYISQVPDGATLLEDDSEVEDDETPTPDFVSLPGLLEDEDFLSKLSLEEMKIFMKFLRYHRSEIPA
jgi:hypothetical protein